MIYLINIIWYFRCWNCWSNVMYRKITPELNSQQNVTEFIISNRLWEAKAKKPRVTSFTRYGSSTWGRHPSMDWSTSARRRISPWRRSSGYLQFPWVWSWQSHFVTRLALMHQEVITGVKVCIKSPWTVVWFSQIVYCLSDNSSRGQAIPHHR